MPNAAGIVGKTSRIASVSGDLAQLEWFDVATVPAVITVANESTDTTCFPAFFNAATGNLAPLTNTGLTFNALTGAFGVASLVSAGTVTGSNLSGTNTGDQTNITGNAATVTTNANSTGAISSVGNLTSLGSFTKAQLDAAVSDDNIAYLGQSQTFVGNQIVTGNITASGTIDASATPTGHRIGYFGQNDSITFGAPGSSYGGFQCGGNGLFSWLGGALGLSLQSSSVLQIGNSSGAFNALGSLACANITASGTVAGTCFLGGVVGGDQAPIVQFPNSGSYRVGIYQPANYQIAFGMTSAGIGGGASAAYAGLLYDHTTTLLAWGLTGRTVSLSRLSDGVIQVGNGGANALGSLACANITASGTGTLGIFTVATLPNASTNAYAEANVSDALTPTMGSTVVAGGAIKTKVRSNGTNWTVAGI